MTKKLYDVAPYATVFSSKVLSCTAADSGYAIILESTLFFPEEGGQSSDNGMICSLFDNQAGNITDVQISKDGTITHYCDAPFAEGDIIKGEINWTHRFSNMQQHTGEHIFSGIINRTFGYENVGFHLSDNEVTMDYNGPLTKEEILEAERQSNEAIAQNIRTICRYPSKEEIDKISYRSKKEIDGDIRIVSIPGYDTCACCAPHVKRTGEIGMIKVVNFQAHRGGMRIWILCGFRALNEFNKLMEAAAVVSKEYSAPVSADSFMAAIEKRNNKTMLLQEKVSVLQEKLLQKEIADLDPEEENVILFVEGFDEIKKRNLLNELVRIKPGFCAVFDGTDADGYSFIIASQNLNSNNIVKILKEKLSARGGGKPEMVQGSVSAAKADIISVLSLVGKQ